MPTTQVQIAEITGLDVSSVNKILNRVQGPVFRKETVKMVFSVAKELGYNFDRGTKATMRVALERLFPKNDDNLVLAITRGVDFKEVIQIKKMLYRGYKVPVEKRE